MPGDAVFFVGGKKDVAEKFAGVVRNRIAEELDLSEKGAFRFCWITDFPMFEVNEETKQIDFSHNPFSMPQGGLEALNTQDPLTIKAFQYDIVCNGDRTVVRRDPQPSAGHHAEGVRHRRAIKPEEVEARFGGMLNAFRYGAPPHGGSAPGIDRIVMMLADEPNIREVILFPLTQQGEDLLMGAPAEIAAGAVEGVVAADRSAAETGAVARGFAPRPRQGALPLGTPPRSEPLEPFILGGVGEGPTGPCKVRVGPLPHPTNGQISKGLAL